LESGRYAAQFLVDAAAAQRSAGRPRPAEDDVDRRLRAYAEQVREQWGSHFTLGRTFAALIGRPAVMRLALGTGMPVPALMRVVVRLLANLTEPRGGGLEDRAIRVLESLTPATKNSQ
jgi:hypothetical protein